MRVEQQMSDSGNGQATAAKPRRRARRRARGVQRVPRLLVAAPEAAAACGVSEATWHRWHAAAACPSPVRIGGVVRWSLKTLRDWASGRVSGA